MERTKIVEQCEGCDRIKDQYCSTYLFPEKKWRLGCPLFPKQISEETARQKRDRFAGKRTSKSAIHGALGYKGLDWNEHSIGRNQGGKRRTGKKTYRAH